MENPYEIAALSSGNLDIGCNCIQCGVELAAFALRLNPKESSPVWFVDADLLNPVCPKCLKIRQASAVLSQHQLGVSA
jgi:hypothetical protein